MTTSKDAGMTTHTVLWEGTRLAPGTVPQPHLVEVWLMNRGIEPINLAVSVTGATFETPDGAAATRTQQRLSEIWAEFDDDRCRRQKARQLWQAAQALPQSTTAERFIKIDAKLDALAMAVAALMRE